MALIEIAAPLFLHPLAGLTVPAVRVAHRQIILRRERRCVGRVSRRRDSMREPTAVTPSAPHEPNPSGSVLRGNCRNGVARTARPRKRLCRTVSSAVNRKRET